MAFSTVAIIFNPNSTGSSKEEAQALKDQLSSLSDIDVHLMPTERAGHAIELAYEAAKSSDRPLIISSSGDGGYNEVINGALRAQSEGATPVCAVLAAGNANDHSHSVGDQPLAEAIQNDATQQIDVLSTTISTNGSKRLRYAHSYVGLGLTPTVAVELNRNNLNRLKETFIVYQTLRRLQPVEIDVNQKRLKIDSLVIANIDRMAKVLTIASNAAPNDGKMNITVFPYRRKLRLIAMLLTAAVKGVRGHAATKYEFIAVKDMAMQLDGEVEQLKAGDLVSVELSPAALTTLA